MAVPHFHVNLAVCVPSPYLRPISAKSCFSSTEHWAAIKFARILVLLPNHLTHLADEGKEVAVILIGLLNKSQLPSLSYESLTIFFRNNGIDNKYNTVTPHRQLPESSAW